MGLKGKNSETGEQLLIFNKYDVLCHWRKAGVLVCPFCNEPLKTVKEHLRRGQWVQAYLSHHTECSTPLAHHEQSPEHYAAKAWILESVPAWYGYDVVTADCEVAMPEINRIADVCFTLTNGERIVHEAQLSPISIEALEERTHDYQSNGCSIVWHFGKAADTTQNRQWAFRRLGGCEILAFDERIDAAA